MVLKMNRFLLLLRSELLGLLPDLGLLSKFCFWVSVAKISSVPRDGSQAAPGLARDFLQSAARDDRDLLLPRDIVGVTAVMRGIADSRRP